MTKLPMLSVEEATDDAQAHVWEAISCLFQIEKDIALSNGGLLDVTWRLLEVGRLLGEVES